jgi:drug/metabolite transporter (DMT)-like permease
VASDASAVGSVALGLASAASWGAGDFSGGLASRRAPALGVLLVSHAVGMAALVLLALFAEPPPARPAWLLWAALAGASGALGLLALYTVLASGRMGVAASVSGVAGAIVPVLVGFLVEGSPGAVRLAAFGLALGGVWLLTAADRAPGDRRIGDFVLASLGGAGLGLFLVFIHQTGGTAVLWPLTVARATSVALLAAAGRATGTLRLPRRGALGLAALAGLLDTGGNACFVVAARVGRLDVAGVLSSLYPASTVLLACLLLGERFTPRQTAGAAASLAAIAVLAW